MKTIFFTTNYNVITIITYCKKYDLLYKGFRYKMTHMEIHPSRNTYILSYIYIYTYILSCTLEFS